MNVIFANTVLIVNYFWPNTVANCELKNLKYGAAKNFRFIIY